MRVCALSARFPLTFADILADILPENGRLFAQRRMFTAVMALLAWPRVCETVVIGTPAAMSSDAALWRRSWKRKCPRPARFAVARNNVAIDAELP